MQHTKLEPYNPAAFAQSLKVGDFCTLGHVDEDTGNFEPGAFGRIRKYTVTEVRPHRILGAVERPASLTIVSGDDSAVIMPSTGCTKSGTLTIGQWDESVAKKIEEKRAADERKRDIDGWWAALSSERKEIVIGIMANLRNSPMVGTPQGPQSSVVVESDCLFKDTAQLTGIMLRARKIKYGN